MPAFDKPAAPLTTPTTVKWRWPSTHPEGRKFVAGAAALTAVRVPVRLEAARLVLRRR